jgi:hypothetical protein
MADEKKRLATLTETEGDLQKKLMTPFIYIKYDILQFPQTICASQNCTEMRIGPNGQPHIFYKVGHIIFKYFCIKLNFRLFAMMFAF